MTFDNESFVDSLSKFVDFFVFLQKIYFTAMKNLLLRSITGIVYVAFICGSVLAGGLSFTIAFGFVAILALNEFYKIVNASNGGEKTLTLIADIVGGLILCAGLACVNTGAFSSSCGLEVLCGGLFSAYLLYLIARLVLQLYTKETSPLINLAYSFMGQVYVALPLGLMSMFYTLPDGKSLLMSMFIMIWLNDTGAFCVGSLIGKHKFFPRISPKKSWEGFIGGVVFAVASSFAFKFGIPQYFESVTIVELFGLGAVVALFATWGDLVESLIKRTLGVKDSGTLLPGHGGILDRIDSLLLVVPASLFYLIVIRLFA